MKTILEGSEAVAEVAALCRPAVLAIYPITPQTHIPENLSQIVAEGKLNAKVIYAESEHSAISACVGASASGVRTYTATSSQGLALMHEILFIASGMRLPIVMTNANRALSAPINIWNDQSDSIAQRDAGWIQLYVETVQEAADKIIQAYKIAEDREILLPVMVNMDGFSLTHCVEPADIPEQEEVDEFLPKYDPSYKLDPNNPMTFGPIAFPNSYTEFRKMQWNAMEKAKEKIKEVNDEFYKFFGRNYGNGLIEEYNTKSAEYIIVSIGSVCGTIKDVIDKHKDVGLIRVISFRPFPSEELKQVLKDVKGIAVIEKDVSIGIGGALWSEVRGFVNNPDKVYSCIAGLGGRDIKKEDIENIIEQLKNGKLDEINWVNANI
ncbi:MAG: pyruvate ferredoxin oxidoreductase [Candidatus Altiarchaeales archaeon A3]|nr:MAG: pyruvate ferredoxin oxidoreductase [Candidatus Altiarchaeales archaeon A3]